MPVPNEEEFLISLRALAEPLPSHLIERISVEMMRDPDPNQALTVIKDLVMYDWDQLQEALNTPAAKWLEGDLMIRRAQAQITKKFIRLSVDDAAEHHYRWLRRRTHDYTSTSQLRWELLQNAKDDLGLFSRHWPLILLHAFHEYHYKPDTVMESSKTAKQLNQLAATARKGIEAATLLKVAEIPRKWPSSQPHADPMDLINNQRDKDLRRIDRALDAALLQLSPVKRNDKTAPERQLVYRIWAGHSDILRRRKIRAIHLILLAEGVRHQIDERNVEKMCASLGSTRRRDVHRYTRRLLSEIRGNNYREDMRQIYEESNREETAAKIGPQLPLP